MSYYEEWDIEREANRKSTKLKARDELSEMLRGKDWDYYITVTTRKIWKDSIALSRECYKKLTEITAVERAFLATEPYYIRSGVHLHGIVKVDDKYRQFVKPYKIWRGLYSRFGRSDVQMVKSGEDVSSYCSKYVVKGEGDYYFWGRKDYW